MKYYSAKTVLSDNVSAPAAIMLSRRPNKRKQWSDEEMVAAINGGLV